MNEKFLKPYNPADTEQRIYDMWEKSGFFNPDVCIEKGVTDKDAEPFSIVLPPPNVTGILHMGHALMVALEDTMIRFKRMQGKRTLWIPGTDHAAIATQSRVEKDIYKTENKSRHDLGREELIKRIDKFAQESHDTIAKQIRRTGASVDWSREAFTLDEKRSFAVRTAFKKMYDDGLIYRKYRVVNWDPKGQTTISDDEIVYEARKAKLYTFKYSKDFPISISTTRPETKVGDTAVAVHPDDARYKEFVGKTFKFDFAGVPVEVKVIADEHVDPAFGTGALGVTPAHSMIDADIAARHDLPMKQVINEYAKMSVEAPALAGKKATEAREIIAAWLRDQGLMEKEEDIDQNVATAERTGGIVEPLPKLQWFIDVNKEFVLAESKISGIPSGSKTSLKNIMRKAVDQGQIDIIPEHFDKTYFHWIDGLRDWCISRQIWYGHRIPVWYRFTDPGVKMKRGEIGELSFKDGLAEMYCGTESPDKVGKGPLQTDPDIIDGVSWTQDSDTLDTWFSSGLWTFTTLGWPEMTADLKTYHPTAVLETGYEILFFWVARMILMTGYFLGDIPFKTVYLHGTVRDAKGQKMSKSLGNGIDPIDIADKYGADAGRMALILSGSAGTDTKLSEDKIKGYKNFANKLWNITRFILSNSEKITLDANVALTEKDKGLLAEFDETLRDVTREIDAYHFHIAAEKLYHYIWNTLADVILKESKPILPDYKTGAIADAAACASRQQTLLRILGGSLKALHPFMPFVTEEIWQLLPEAAKETSNGGKMLMVERWPIV